MTPIQLDFKPSALLIALMLFFAGMIGLIVMLVDLAWYWQLIIIVTLVASTAYAISMHGTLNLPWSVVKLTVNAKQKLHVVHKDGQRILAQVEASSVVTPYLTILQLTFSKVQNEKAWRNHQAIIVLPDNVEREAYRQLRVWLRWGKFKKSDQPSLP
jgi:toxin CptA